MVRLFRSAAVAAVIAVAAAMPASAQSSMISAQRPASLVDALDMAGFKPVLGTDKTGEPKIDIELTGYKAAIYFYGCDETTHDNCDSIQFMAGFDRKKPWSEKDAARMNADFRYATVTLDKEGDPWVTWDVVMGDGIPAKTFLSAVNAFGVAMDNVSSEAFKGE